ncbi:MAG: CapA family protein [Oscillospiraceae bacterium]|nr:CapA family protein [Oscillospiraceae bacterium]
MALENDDLYKRREQRAAYERKRRAKQMRKRRTMLILAAVLIVCIVVIAVLISRAVSQNPPPTEPPTDPPVTTAPPSTEPTEPETVIHIVAGGDLNITDASVAAGFTGSGYNYTDVFLDIAPILAAADLTVLNLEGNVCGAPYGTQSTSAPPELLQALAAAGVDMLQVANSCSINNGLLGLSDTLDAVRAAGMEPLGAWATAEEAKNAGGYTLVDVQGIRVALVAFTKGMGNMGLPSGSESCVNVLYKDYASAYQEVDTEGITAILSAVEEQKPDITIALLHWGSEYNDLTSKTQKQIVELMTGQGVDAIIGTHPHYVQQVHYDENADTVVAYSLGDFFGSADANGTYYSILLDLQITRDNATGKTEISDCDYIPIYTLTQERDEEPMRVLRLEEAMLAYENSHIHRVSATTYENMKYALARIRDRVKVDEE